MATPNTKTQVDHLSLYLTLNTIAFDANIAPKFWLNAKEERYNPPRWIATTGIKMYRIIIPLISNIYVAKNVRFLSAPAHIDNSAITISQYGGNVASDVEMCVLYTLLVSNMLSVDYRFSYGPCYQERPYICQLDPRRRYPRYDRVTWFEAQEQCAGINATLAWIPEHDYLLRYNGRDRYFWIGIEVLQWRWGGSSSSVAVRYNYVLL